MASKITDLTVDKKVESSDILLTEAIYGMNKETLCALLERVCAENSSAKALIQSEVLVSSDRIVPYHADTDSEDDESVEKEENEEEIIKPAVKDNIRRQCARCPEEFTHADNEAMDENEQMECVWHTGTKKIDKNSDVWYGYNPGRGPKKLHIDDPAYEDGFRWSCCNHPGSSGGCQEGKHIAEGEENIKKEEEDSPKIPKRKADQTELEGKSSVYLPRYATCENCTEQFDLTDNDRGACIWHKGIKMVDYGSEMWADHEENCHGPYESFKDDPDYQKGFIWPCCEVPGDIQGCKQTKHKALKVQERKKRRC